MPVVLKKPRAAAEAHKPKGTLPPAQVVSEVDVLIARLKKIRKGQRGGIDIHQAIEAGRD